MVSAVRPIPITASRIVEEIAVKILITEDDTGIAPANCRFHAIDEDTYDGAEDSRNRSQIGWGATRIAAIRDLLDLLDDKD